MSVAESKAAFERTTPRLVEPDTEENLQRLFLENNWTDKLPIVLPTEKRVAEMLAHTSRKPDEVVGHMRSNQFRVLWEFTVEKVAVNAVMAGARPEYFPVILALAATGVSARGSTTSSIAAMVVVNGPIRDEGKMNSGTGAMAPFNHAKRNMLRGMDAHSAPTFLLDPIAARQFIDRGGFDTKEKFIQWIYENALMPAGEYWDYQLIQNYIYPRATFGEEPYASKLKAAPDELVPMFKHDDIEVVVVGGETNGYWRIMSARLGNQVSVDDWR